MGKFFFFFGCQIYDHMRKERDCVSEIVIYDPVLDLVSMTVPEHVPDRLLMGRKYFAGFLLNDTFYCHGGIDSNGKATNQFVEIDLHTMIWKDVKFPKSDGRKEFKKYDNVAADGTLDHIYGHKMCVVSYKRSYLAMD